MVAIAAEKIAELADRRRYPPAGRMLPIVREKAAGFIHWDARGQGSPAVVLESGLTATSLSWALVQDEVARDTQVASYDRAGLGWSPRSPAKLSVAGAVRDLAEMLQSQAGLQPAILVGHSFGGLLVRAFAAHYPERVAGLILVDPVSIDHWSQGGAAEQRRLALGAKLARRGALLAHLGVVRLCLFALVSGRATFPRVMARVSGAQGTNLINRLVGEVSRLPPSLWPAVRAHWSRPASFHVMADYLETLHASTVAAKQLTVPAHIPLTILSAASATPAELLERARWVDQSTTGAHLHVPGCGHWIQLQRPEVVTRAVCEMIALVRARTHHQPPSEHQLQRELDLP